MLNRSVLQRAALCAILVCGCDGAYDSLSASGPVTFDLHPHGNLILSSFGDTVRFRLIVRDASGKVIPAIGVAWTSSDPGIVRVDSTSGIMVKDTATILVRAMGNGGANVVATFGNEAVTGSIMVSQQVARYRIVNAAGDSTPQFSSFGDTMTAIARALDARGNAWVGGTDAMRARVFASSNPGMVTVNPTTGLMTAVGSSIGGGFYTPARIYVQSATTDSMRAYVLQLAATLTINGPRDDTLSVGQEKVFTASAKDARGNAITFGSAVWLSRNFSLFRVDSVGGLGRGIAAGNTFLIAVRDNKRDSIAVVVR